MVARTVQCCCFQKPDLLLQSNFFPGRFDDGQRDDQSLMPELSIARKLGVGPRRHTETLSDVGTETQQWHALH